MGVTGGDILVEVLTSAGVDTVFGLPGVQLDGLYDALARNGSFRVISTRNEQAASYMADGYARVTGRIGVCMVVPGPGLLNAMAGLATAYACGSRVLCITGQVRSDMIGSGLGLLHEIRNQLEMARSVVKWSGRAMSVGKVASVATEALVHIDTGRPGPVLIEVPPDVLESRAPVMPAVSIPAATPMEPSRGDIDGAAALLDMAKKPLIVSGGGVLQSAAWDELRSIAEQLEAPVLLTSNGKGGLPSSHPLTFEGLATEPLLREADLVLAVGTRFAKPLGRRRTLRPGQRLVRIDIDVDELTRAVQPTVAIHADARLALRLLSQRCKRQAHRSGWDTLDDIRVTAKAEAASLQPQGAYAAAIRSQLPEDAIVVEGMTQVGYWCRLGFPVEHPRSWLTSGYQGTLGFELPTGLGAQLGQPAKRVVIIVGDGGFLYNGQEFATAVQYGINVIALVFNDSAYGNVRRIQRQRFDGRIIGSELRNPDFVRFAGSFGAVGLRANSPTALSAQLNRALAMPKPTPTLIEIVVNEMPDPWPLLLRI
jgi:acetolactate synthase-1/2/3 large subunit